MFYIQIIGVCLISVGAYFHIKNAEYEFLTNGIGKNYPIWLICLGIADVIIGLIGCIGFKQFYIYVIGIVRFYYTNNLFLKFYRFL